MLLFDSIPIEFMIILLIYTGDILLVGINYDKKTKKHECVIEQYEK